MILVMRNCEGVKWDNDARKTRRDCSLRLIDDKLNYFSSPFTCDL